MDVNGDGRLDATRWTGAQDGVLVWNKYHDGQVHDHTQFAFAQYDTTSAAKGKTATDLSGLAQAFDSNHDGVFDAQYAQFADFTVWQDANQNRTRHRHGPRESVQSAFRTRQPQFRHHPQSHLRPGHPTPRPIRYAPLTAMARPAAPEIATPLRGSQ